MNSVKLRYRNSFKRVRHFWVWGTTIEVVTVSKTFIILIIKTLYYRELLHGDAGRSVVFYEKNVVFKFSLLLELPE